MKLTEGVGIKKWQVTYKGIPARRIKYKKLGYKYLYQKRYLISTSNIRHIMSNSNIYLIFYPL